MNKPSIEEWAKDCKGIGTKARRFCYATRCLSDAEAQHQRAAMTTAVQEFANKYGIDFHSAQEVAYILSDGVDLGLAY